MPESQPLSVVEKYQNLRQVLPYLEDDVGANHDELDLLNEVLGDMEYQALGEVYDILTMQLPEPEEGSVNMLVGEVLDTINTEYRPAKHARELRQILSDDHFKAFLESYEDIVTKAYASDNDDSWDFGKPEVDIVETNVDTGKPISLEREDDVRSNKKDNRRESKKREDRHERKPRKSEDDEYKDDERKRREIKQELEQKLDIKPRLAVEEDLNGDSVEDEDDENNRRDKRRKDGKDRNRNERKPQYSDDDYDDDRDSRRRDERQGRYGSYDPPAPVFDQYKENHRFVLIRKSSNESLGITVRQDEDNNLFVAKIRQNSLADKQSSLQVGDIVKELNGNVVLTPDDIMKLILEKQEEWIIFKIVPVDISLYSSAVTFLRTCVSYNSMNDRLIPYKTVGLSYEKGDILAVLDDSDENWWQARIIDGPDSPLGLIPSRALQEKRQAFVQPEATKTKSSLLCGMGKKKKKVGYDAANASEYEDGHVKIYDEIELSDSFHCSLILIGVDKDAKRHLKERITREFPSKYATVVPETSRPMKPKDKQGRGFIFVDRETMKIGIKQNHYIEEGEYNGHWYGLRTSSIHDVINTGKICVLDIAPEYLKTLMCIEFRPVVVFIAAPRWESVKARRGYRKGRRINNNKEEEEDDEEAEERCRELEKESQTMKEDYHRNFDEVIVNDDLDNTYENLVAYVDSVMTAKKWVPKNYGKTI